MVYFPHVYKIVDICVPWSPFFFVENQLISLTLLSKACLLSKSLITSLWMGLTETCKLVLNTIWKIKNMVSHVRCWYKSMLLFHFRYFTSRSLLWFPNYSVNALLCLEFLMATTIVQVCPVVSYEGHHLLFSTFSVIFVFSSLLLLVFGKSSFWTTAESLPSFPWKSSQIRNFSWSWRNIEPQYFLCSGNSSSMVTRIAFYPSWS